MPHALLPLKKCSWPQESLGYVHHQQQSHTTANLSQLLIWLGWLRIHENPANLANYARLYLYIDFARQGLSSREATTSSEWPDGQRKNVSFCRASRAL